MSRMKVGPHMIMRGDSDATTWLYGKPTVGKLVNCGIPSEFAGSPDYLWVGRCFEQQFDPNNPIGGGWSADPTQAARDYVALSGAVRSRALRHSDVGGQQRAGHQNRRPHDLAVLVFGRVCARGADGDDAGGERGGVSEFACEFLYSRENDSDQGDGVIWIYSHSNRFA